MSCKCKSRKIVYHDEKVYHQNDFYILPYTQCNECCLKHLSYAFTSFQSERKFVALGHSFLALMHNRKSKLIYDLILSILHNDENINDQFNKIFDSELKNENEEVNELKLFEWDDLDEEEIILLSGINALGRENGYWESNKATMIGLFSRCEEIETNEIIKDELRSLRKMVENDYKILDAPVALIYKINRIKNKDLILDEK